VSSLSDFSDPQLQLGKLKMTITPTKIANEYKIFFFIINNLNDSTNYEYNVIFLMIEFLDKTSARAL
jgi:hypothetical protein